jgi:antitoxin (DNA-binding transcriptional repressor) of toxin-antitoxin stability system
MSVIHVTAAEAARDFAALLARVRAGEEVVIEDGVSPSVILRMAEQPRGRRLSESLALAEAHTRERGYEVIMDPDFAADVEERIRARKPRDTSVWD